MLNRAHEEKIAFRKQLKCYIERRRVTAAELARKTGVPKQTLSDWLAGTRPRNMQYVKRVADELQVSISELFFGQEREENKSSLQASLVAATRPLPAPASSAKAANPIYTSSFFFRCTQSKVQVVDLMTGYALEISPSLVAVLGWQEEELKRTHWLEWSHPDDRDTLLGEIQRSIVSPHIFSGCRHRFLHREGQSLVFDSTFYVDITRNILVGISVNQS